MAAPLAVRIATPADVPAIVALVNAAFALEKAFVDGERTSATEIQELFGKGLFLIADGEGPAPAACAYVEQRGFRAYMGMLSVDPARQGTGLGRAMMDAIEAFCRGRRVRSLDIRILSLRTELPPFYQRLGFVDEGTSPCENSNLRQPAHFLLMSKNIA